jgi:hypothetical protein
MKLKMGGHDKTATKYVTTDESKKVSGRNSKGYFDTYTDWDDARDPITVTFTNTKYINGTLTGKEPSDAGRMGWPAAITRPIVAQRSKRR